MNARSSFYRKIVYLALIAVLLFPISQLGAPSTLEDEGGSLAQIRDDPQYNLGQSNLGEIDPASETIRLATLGLRGVAVSMLWSKAVEYKKKEDYTNCLATINQLAKLQPYFISFWRFQAWNLSYNVSVEMDDVRDRFYYVKRGIEFLKEGIKYNRDNPILLSDLGWFLGNKIGKADEHEHYRRLFKADEEFHPEDRPPKMRDNWLVSKYWYDLAVSAVDDKKRSLEKKNPVTFYDKPAMSQINYSEAIEKEGEFYEDAEDAWATSARLWREFGDRGIQSTQGTTIRLASYNRLQEEKAEIEEQLESLMPGARDAIMADRRSMLTADQLAAYDLPPSEVAEGEQAEQRAEAQRMLNIQPYDLANYIGLKAPEKSAEARKLANQLIENTEQLFLVRINREVANYDYWKTRCEFEQTAAARNARRLAYAGKRAFKQADLLEAQRLYEESFDSWTEVFKDYPELPEDSTTCADLMEYVDDYATVLKQLELTLGDEEIDIRFPLWEVVEFNDNEGKYVADIEEHRKRMAEK